MNQIYSELVANEFYATYGRMATYGQLAIDDLVHPKFKLSDDKLYVILHTGIISIELGDPAVIDLHQDRILSLSPSTIRSLTDHPRFTKRFARQLNGFAERIESRLNCLTKARLRELSKEIEDITMGRRSAKFLNDCTQEFWTYVYYPEEVSLKKEA